MFHPERRYLNKELTEQAKAGDAVVQNDAEQYYRHQAKAERYAERVDRAHDKHVVKESKYLNKELAQHNMAQESLARGDTAKFAHHEYKAARYHNKAGRTNGRRHVPTPPTHHQGPFYGGGAPGMAFREEAAMSTYGGVPPLGAAPMGIVGATFPAATTVTSTTTSAFAPPMPPMAEPLMGTMGGYGYSEEVYTRPSGYFEAPPLRRSLPPQIGRDFEVVGLGEPDFIPTNRPLGIAPEFRRGFGAYW